MSKWFGKGNFKAAFVIKPYAVNEWKLYDLSLDPGGMTHLSMTNPGRVTELIREKNMHTRLE